MESVRLALARRIVPELLDSLRDRARILLRIHLLAPIGRRALATEMGATERVLRTEVEFLKAQGLIAAAPNGMSLSEEGEALLGELDEIVAGIEGRTEVTAALRRMLDIPEVIVVAGDSDSDSWVHRLLGHQAARTLLAEIRSQDVVAVTGGTTMAALAAQMPVAKAPLSVKVVPARGGLGEDVAIQANTVASVLAQRLGGVSMMLHVPDRLSEGMLEQLLADPYLRDRLPEIRGAQVVVHGIGDALQMADRRQLPPPEVDVLQQQMAVAEAFGYYFDADGRPVWAMTTVGLQLADLDGVRTVIAVAGGRSKARAVAAAARAYRIDRLITDEACATAILALDTAATIASAVNSVDQARPASH